MPEATYPSLADRVAFVTGGGSGIGEALVRGLVGQGSRVVFVDRAAEPSRALAAELGSAVRYVELDVTDVARLEAVIGEVAEREGPLSILFNNVADDSRRRVADQTPELWDAAFAVSLRTHFFAARAAAIQMRRIGGGSIVNFGSTSWKIRVRDLAHYTVAKSAVHGLTRTLAGEFGADRIRVNTLTPGWVMTAKQLTLWVDEAAEREIDASQLLPGRVMPDDIAAMALFLAADDSRMITSKEFVVDGGWT